MDIRMADNSKANELINSLQMTGITKDGIRLSASIDSNLESIYSLLEKRLDAMGAKDSEHEKKRLLELKGNESFNKESLELLKQIASGIDKKEQINDMVNKDTLKDKVTVDNSLASITNNMGRGILANRNMQQTSFGMLGNVLATASVGMPDGSEDSPFNVVTTSDKDLIENGIIPILDEMGEDLRRIEDGIYGLEGMERKQLKEDRKQTRLLRRRGSIMGGGTGILGMLGNIMPTLLKGGAIAASIAGLVASINSLKTFLGDDFIKKVTDVFGVVSQTPKALINTGKMLDLEIAAEEREKERDRIEEEREKSIAQEVASRVITMKRSNMEVTEEMKDSIRREIYYNKYGESYYNEAEEEREHEELLAEFEKQKIDRFKRLQEALKSDLPERQLSDFKSISKIAPFEDILAMSESAEMKELYNTAVKLFGEDWARLLEVDEYESSKENIENLEKLLGKEKASKISTMAEGIRELQSMRESAIEVFPELGKPTGFLGFADVRKEVATLKTLDKLGTMYEYPNERILMQNKAYLKEITENIYKEFERDTKKLSSQEAEQQKQNIINNVTNNYILSNNIVGKANIGN